MIFILFILIYVTGSKLYFKNIYFLHGNSGKTVWKTEDLQKVGHDFQLQDDGSFLSGHQTHGLPSKNLSPSKPSCLISVKSAKNTMHRYIFLFR